MNIKRIALLTRKKLNLKIDMENEETILETVRKDADFTGANLWVLMLAIVIASVGLNVNSGAVIIGAMLISPLMGPIIGIGVALAVQDFSLLKLALKNILFAVSISLFASVVYFLLTPFDQPQSEIINRTSPTIFDVFIALAGGTAGMIASSRKTRGNVIPGVAIATALMPPLCTAGYGLASLNFKYFFGAFYLFFINCVFIFLGTFLVVKLLHFRRVVSADQFLGLRIQRLITILAVLTIIPSCFLAYQMIERTFSDKKIDAFLSKEVSAKGLVLIEKKVTRKKGQTLIEVSAVGPQVSETLLKGLNEKLALYLPNADLKFNYIGTTKSEIESMKSSLMAEFRKGDNELTEKDKKIALLNAEILASQKSSLPSEQIESELKILFPEVTSLLLASAEGSRAPVLLGFIEVKGKIGAKEKASIMNWLKVRTKTENLKLSFENL